MMIPVALMKSLCIFHGTYTQSQIWLNIIIVEEEPFAYYQMFYHLIKRAVVRRFSDKLYSNMHFSFFEIMIMLAKSPWATHRFPTM